MKANQAEFPVRVMCRVLGVSPSGRRVRGQRGVFLSLLSARP